MTLDEIIKDLRNQIQVSKNLGEDQSKCSWQDEQGIILTPNEAQLIVDKLELC